MSQDSDLLFTVLALQMNFITKEQLVECGALWATDRSKSLSAIIDEKGYLAPEEKIALDAMLKAQVKRFGDPAQSLAAFPVDEDIRRSLLALPFEEGVMGTLMEYKAGPPKSDAVENVVLTKPREERYRLGAEIGRGGLGRVMAARDTVLDREVAVKEMMAGKGSTDILKRFLREGEIAGRLSHPNVIPVHDIGVREEEGTKTPYFVMTRIVGRDLKEIIKAVEEGDEKARHDFSRPRLLRVFQDVCLAMAYAHHHGVIHRDLKPANVMVGQFGEVFVVDWGLAKIKGLPDLPDAPSGQTDQPDQSGHASRPTGSSDGPALTIEGDVLGTPQYMPPEQADGRIEDVDERSDIYSLGAILYEVLTFRPPFEGTTALNVVAKVLTDDLTPPSTRTSEVRRKIAEARRLEGEPPGEPKADGSGGPSPSKEEITFPESVPPELEEIVLKAMAKDRAQRFARVMDLHDEVQRFLEGEKERERKRLEAIQKVEEGRNHFARFREMAGEIEREEKALKEVLEKVKPWTPVEEKRPLWEKRDRLQEMREERMEEFGNAEVAFGQAMASDPSNPGGREGLCDLYLERYFAAEKRHDREETALYLNLLAKRDGDGNRLAEIEKPGSLTLRTFAYPCDCLRPVKNPKWRVEFGEEPVWPWRDGRALPGEEVKDDDRPVPEIKVFPEGARFGHKDSCRKEEVEGVEVTIHKFEEKDKRLVLGEEKRLGKTPLKDVELERGSYLCLLHDPEYREVRLPVQIDRGGTWEQEVNLYRKEEIPDGFCYVPSGPFSAGDEKAGGVVDEERRTEDLFIAKHPVTFGEYIEFLNEVESRDPEEARTRQPREGDQKFLVEEDRRWRIPASSSNQVDQDEENPLGLTERMPVMGISWHDAMAYCAWWSAREGRVYTPPHEEEFEKTARGVDGRVYPWGDEYDGTFSNTTVSHEGGSRIREVGSFPVDESAFGAIDMAGNMQTWCLDAPEKTQRQYRCLRGGAWSNTPALARGGFRSGNVPSFVYRNLGIRLVFRSRALHV